MLTGLDPVLHMLGLASPWLELDSNDPHLADVSAKVSGLEPCGHD
jgi:hypothetical protein